MKFSEIVASSQNGYGSRRAVGDSNVVLRLADIDSESWQVATSDLRAIGMSSSDRAKYALRPGDLLVVRVNGSPAIAGRVVPYSGPIGFAYCDHFIRFQLTGLADARFVAYQFRHRPVREQVERGMVSTAGQHTVSQRTFADVTLELPPLHEQHRIVYAIEAQFSRIDAAVASLTRAKANVKRARASVLKAAVEGRLVPTEAALARAEGRDYEPASVLLHRIVAEGNARWRIGKKEGPPAGRETGAFASLPEGWDRTTLDAVTSLITSGSRGWADYYSATGAIFVRSQDINSWRLDLSSVAHVDLPPRAKEGTRTRLIKNDVLVIITGANVTVAARVRDDMPEAYVSQHVALCRPIEPSTSAYLHLWLWSSRGHSQLEQAAYGAGKPGLNLSNVREVMVALPPVAEQSRIVAEVERRLSVLDTVDATIDANLARCARLRQSILKRAFEGRLVPAEAPAPEVPLLAAEPPMPPFAKDAAP